MSDPTLVVALDTNVLISALLGLGRPTSSPRTILEAFRDAVFTLAMSPVLLGEFTDVVTRPEFRLLIPREEIDTLLEDIHRHARIVHPTETLRLVLDDPSDDRLFACALAADAAYLVSGDKAVLGVKRVGRLRVIAPAAFVAILSHQ